jgi:hypothetical protein
VCRAIQRGANSFYFSYINKKKQNKEIKIKIKKKKPNQCGIIVDEDTFEIAV